MELPLNEIICGDCLEVMKDWPDNCVDLVLTDPPYVKESIYLYTEMAKLLPQICRQGAFIYAYCGAEFIPKTLCGMVEFLDWFWLYNIKHIGGTVRFWAKCLMVTSKPVLVFTNGTVSQKYIKWSAIDFERETQTKDFHVWGQGINFPLLHVEIRTKPNSLVLDPFCGSGTTCVAAKMLGRNYIGIDISEKYCEIARMRLEAVDTGVPVKEQKAGQMPLWNE